MPYFESHLTQAKSNLEFLANINHINEFWDWKVTVSFYVAVHLVNAHIAKLLTVAVLALPATFCNVAVALAETFII